MAMRAKLIFVLLVAILVEQACSEDDPTSYIPRAVYLQSPDSSLAHTRVSAGLRIINGYEARIGQFPYQVALGVFTRSNSFFCGAVLLTRTTVLTAAHCVQGALDIKVFLGVFNLMDYYDEEGSYITFVEPPFIRVHPSYSSSNYYNDIAILTLDVPVPLSNTIKTVKLPKQPYIVNNSTVLTITGWGKIRDNAQPITDTLHYYNISGQDYASCAVYYKTKANNYTLSSSHICTSGVGKVGPCRGDSGGPLIQINSDGSYLLVGLNSLGVTSCEVGAPNLFTEVYKYVDWIKTNTDYRD